MINTDNYMTNEIQNQTHIKHLFVLFSLLDCELKWEKEFFEIKKPFWDFTKR